jgi:mono/diheme cytochrome c family protein
MTRLPRPVFSSFPMGLVLAAALAMAAPGVSAQVVPPGQPTQPAPGQAVKPNPANGRIIAQRWCAECHVVSPEQTSAKADVPTFAAIAAKGGLSEAALRQFLMNPHPVMPDMQLGRAEAADLAAYIETQTR